MNVKNETKEDIIFEGVRGIRRSTSTFDNTQHQAGSSSAAMQLPSSLLEVGMGKYRVTNRIPSSTQNYRYV
jgi:hypothetical protein